MKAKYTKIAGLAVAIIASGVVYIVSLHAQPSITKSSAPPVTTNWVGYLAFGVPETHFRMPGAGNALLKADSRVLIGLRSDGIVVWREMPKMQ